MFKKGVKGKEMKCSEVKFFCGMSVAFMYGCVWVLLYSMWLPYLYIFLKLFVLCHSSRIMVHSIWVVIMPFIFVLFFCMFCFLFCVFCNLYCFSLCVLLCFPFVSKCKDHCHRMETQLQWTAYCNTYCRASRTTHDDNCYTIITNK